uniref:Putative secreted protein n=1 Tax=Anopheles marajoara TaxID=58244 RepID=A0A2M4C9N1_9DIPT
MIFAIIIILPTFLGANDDVTEPSFPVQCQINVAGILTCAFPPSKNRSTLPKRKKETRIPTHTHIMHTPGKDRRWVERLPFHAGSGQHTGSER